MKLELTPRVECVHCGASGGCDVPKDEQGRFREVDCSECEVDCSECGTRQSLCPSCKDDHYGPQWAIVAVSSVSATAVVLDCSRALGCDMRSAGIDAEDAWGFEHEDAGRLLRWDGRIVYSGDSYHEFGHDVDYEGTFRPLSVPRGTED